MHEFGGVVVSSADREAFLNSRGDASAAQGAALLRTPIPWR